MQWAVSYSLHDRYDLLPLPLREYALKRGYDIEEHPTNTPEEEEKEKKRAKNQLDNFRKAIRQDLDIIHASTLTWTEDIKSKSKDYARVSLVTYTGIRNGEIKISFSPELATYLAERNLITQFPTKLLRIPGTNPNAYRIGKKLSEYYNNFDNQARETHDRLSVKTLLGVTDLPSYEKVQDTDRGHWQERIKEPLEKALDTLTGIGFLADWEYTHAKAVPLTDEEASNITNYKDFSELYIHFQLVDEIDNTEKIEEKRKARAEAKQKQSKTAKKNK